MKGCASIILSVLLILSLASFVIADQGIQAQNGTGEYHDENVEAG
jgi:hypothetical protein